MKKIKLLSAYFKRFGLKGIQLLFKQVFLKNKTVSISLPGYAYSMLLRNNTSDMPTFYDVIFEECYLIDFGFIPEVIVDCGANIGLASVFFKNRYPDARIIAIEPDKNNFKVLEENIKPYKNISCLNKGIWNRHTNLLVKDPGLGNYGFMVEETYEESDNTIEAISIDKILQDYKLNQIDILKIDIEGSEKEMFASNYEHWLPKVKVIIIELHDHMRSGASKSFFKALTNYDFRFMHKGENIICFMKQ